MASGSGAAAGPAAHVGATAAITVEREPAAARLSELGVRSWPKWGGPPGRYALSYGARQTCYIVRGKASATVEGSPESSCTAQFGAGDLSSPGERGAPGTSSPPSTCTTPSIRPNSKEPTTLLYAN